MVSVATKPSALSICNNHYASRFHAPTQLSSLKPINDTVTRYLSSDTTLVKKDFQESNKVLKTSTPSSKSWLKLFCSPLFLGNVIAASVGGPLLLTASIIASFVIADVIIEEK